MGRRRRRRRWRWRPESEHGVRCSHLLFRGKYCRTHKPTRPHIAVQHLKALFLLLRHFTRWCPRGFRGALCAMLYQQPPIHYAAHLSLTSPAKRTSACTVVVVVVVRRRHRAAAHIVSLLAHALASRRSHIPPSSKPTTQWRHPPTQWRGTHMNLKY